MSSVSLQDCLELFTQEETLEGDERPVSIFFWFFYYCFLVIVLL